MSVEIVGPDAIEVVLLAHVGEEARGRYQIAQPAASRLERLFQILHRQHGLLAHRRRQVELLVAVRMAVIHGGRGDARQEDEPATRDDDAGCVGHVDVGAPVGVVHDRDVLGHHSSSSFSRRSLISRVPTVMRR